MNRGFIGWLILIIIALALAKYFFDWSIFDAVNSEKGRETIEYIKNVIDVSWNWVKTTVMKIYGQIS
jgi:hypothetical protein